MKTQTVILAAALIVLGFGFGIVYTSMQPVPIVATPELDSVAAELERVQQEEFENQRVEQYDTGQQNQPLLAPNPNAVEVETRPVVTMHVFKDEELACPACDRWKATEQKKVEKFADVEIVPDVVDRSAPYFEYCGEEREEYQTAEEIKAWIDEVENAEFLEPPTPLSVRLNEPCKLCAERMGMQKYRIEERSGGRLMVIPYTGFPITGGGYDSREDAAKAVHDLVYERVSKEEYGYPALEASAAYQKVLNGEAYKW